MTLIHPFNYLVLRQSFLPSLCLSFFVPSYFSSISLLTLLPALIRSYRLSYLLYHPSLLLSVLFFSSLRILFLFLLFPSLLLFLIPSTLSSLIPLLLSSFTPFLLSCFLVSNPLSFLSSFRLLPLSSRHHSFLPFFLHIFCLPSFLPLFFPHIPSFLTVSAFPFSNQVVLILDEHINDLPRKIHGHQVGQF